jgi:hypothetical protein
MICRDWKEGAVTTEEILSNSVHRAPFWYLSICVYCGQRVDVTSITSWIQHFMSLHRRLFTSIFTCPACIGIRVMNRAEFLTHWETVHARTLGLIVVCDESNVSPRLATGLALTAALKTVESLQLDPTEIILVVDEPVYNVTRHGGYAPATSDPRALANEVRLAQGRDLPGDWRSEKEIREEEAARKRAAQGQAVQRPTKQRQKAPTNEWREPTPVVRSAASSRAASPSPRSSSWADVASGQQRAASEAASPGVPGEDRDWDGNLEALRTLIHSRRNSGSASERRTDDGDEVEMGEETEEM